MGPFIYRISVLYHHGTSQAQRLLTLEVFIIYPSRCSPLLIYKFQVDHIIALILLFTLFTQKSHWLLTLELLGSRCI